MLRGVICGGCVSAGYSVLNRNLLSVFVMRVSYAFSTRLLQHQGYLIDTLLSFYKNIHFYYKSCSGVCFNESKRRLFFCRRPRQCRVGWTLLRVEHHPPHSASTSTHILTVKTPVITHSIVNFVSYCRLKKQEDAQKRRLSLPE